jgi:hypothetical protein
MDRTTFLLRKLTAFRSLADLRGSMAGGYIPTILCRTARHGELVRALRAAGIEVRT